MRALTHRSFSADHYERLEFLGDAVLGMAVAHMLYEAQGELPEGELSRVRAKLVRQDSLHQLALKLGLPALLRLGEGSRLVGIVSHVAELRERIGRQILVKSLPEGGSTALVRIDE